MQVSFNNIYKTQTLYQTKSTTLRNRDSITAVPSTNIAFYGAPVLKKSVTNKVIMEKAKLSKQLTEILKACAPAKTYEELMLASLERARNILNYKKRKINEYEKEIETNRKKDIINICSKFAPRELVKLLLEEGEIQPTQKAGELSGTKINLISKLLTTYKFHVTSASHKEGIVTAGGVDLNEINSKTMESKKIKKLFFCGEVMNIDGLTGGFNLQNCWSTGFIAGNAITNYNLEQP